METLLFLDTNIYIHYQDFDQIGWLEVAQAEAVTIVVPPVTVRELNRLKDSQPGKRVRTRAASVLRKLSGLLADHLEARIAPRVHVRLEDRDATIDFGSHNLSPDIWDDQLIASMIMCRSDTPDSPPVLVTSDEGLALLAKAKRHAIPVIRLSESLRLPDEPDPDQKRIRDLEQEVRHLKLIRPQLAITYADGSQHAHFALSPCEVPGADAIDHQLSELRKRYPKAEPRASPDEKARSPSTLTLRDALEGAQMSTLQAVSPGEVTRYNDDLSKFYQLYAAYLRDIARVRDIEARTIALQIYLTNDGTAPAEDIDVFLQFPNGFILRTEDDLPRVPESPNPPAPPKTIIQTMLDPMQRMATLPYLGPIIAEPILPPPNVSSPRITRTQSYDVDLHVERLKHKLREDIDALYVTFQSFDSAHSFGIDYRILAANLPEEASGTLHVSITRADLSEP